MKISTQITAALLALGIASQAGADPVIYLTGSSAFRSTVELTLANNTGANGNLFDSGSVTYVTYGNSSAGSANYMVFHGTINSQPVYIDCAWSGSEAGIASVCDTNLDNTDRNGDTIPLNGSPEAWLDVTKVTLSDNSWSTNPPTSLMENGGVPDHGADLAQADTSQAVSWTPAVNGTTTDIKDYGVEGMVTFTWSRNVQTTSTHEWLDCSNATLPELNVLLASGYVPASLISGNPADDDMAVYCVGRNRGSGTRMNTLADTVFGTHNTVNQYSIGLGVEEPANGELLLTKEGNDGYESGGGVGTALSIPGSCQQPDPINTGLTGWFALGYSSPSDLLSHGVNTNNWVALDGVMESNGAIENGSYPFWGHEHLYGRYQIQNDTFANSVGTNLFNAVKQTLVSQNYGVDPGGHDPGIPVSLMNVKKTSDTAFPSF
jgi:hypothetical protein